MSPEVTHHGDTRDRNMVARGYCGCIDEQGDARCYRRAGHDGRCAFSRCFQLPQADAPHASFVEASSTAALAGTGGTEKAALRGQETME